MQAVSPPQQPHTLRTLPLFHYPLHIHSAGPQPTPAVTAVMAGAPEDGTHTYTRDYMKSLASGYNTRPATLDAAPWMDDFLLAQPRPFNPGGLLSQSQCHVLRPGGRKYV